MKISNTLSWQTLRCVKGNHRRTVCIGMYILWGQREYLWHSSSMDGTIETTIYKKVVQNSVQSFFMNSRRKYD